MCLKSFLPVYPVLAANRALLFLILSCLLVLNFKGSRKGGSGYLYS